MKTAALIIAIALGLGAAGPALADQTALGDNGQLFRVETGTMAQLFPAAKGNLSPALALSIVTPGAPTQRLLVPGTEGREVENTPSVVFEPTSSLVYLIWESRSNYIHSQIRLIAFQAGHWSSDIELTGTFFSLKTAPSLAVTRDTYWTFDASGSPVRHQRTIFHTLWWEEATGGERVVYSPVVLLDGSYLGWNPLFVLNDLIDGEPANALPATPDLARSPAIQSGPAGDSVVISFVDSKTRQLVQLELSTVAGELGALTSAVAQDLGHQAGLFPSNLPALGDRARAQLVDFGYRLHMHPGLLAYLGSMAQSYVTSQDAGQLLDLGTLVDKARAQLVDFGYKMVRQGLGESRDHRSWLFEFPSIDPRQGSIDGSPLHSLGVRLAAERPVPTTESGATTVYASRNGSEALVAWSTRQELRYRESMGAGWSEVHSLPLDVNMSLQAAQLILEQRIRNR